MLLGKVAKSLAIGAVACLLATTSLTAWGEETGTPKKGGTLTVGIQDDSQTLDPIASVQWSERQMLFLIFDTLVTLGPDFSIHPMLADKWDTSDDGKTVTLHLHPGIKFQDGTDFDAAAVKWNFDRRMDPATGSAQRKQLAVIDSVEVVDKATVAADLTFVPAWADGAASYPITSPTYVLVDAVQKDQAHANAITAYLDWVLTKAQTEAQGAIKS